MTEAKEGQCKDKGWWDKMKDQMMGEKVFVGDDGKMVIMSA